MKAFVIFFLLGALGCAKSGADEGMDMQDGAATSDAGAVDTFVGCPTGRTGPGCKMCSGGFHMCGADCVQDKPNDPDAGCAKSCGGACMAPSHASGKCTADGTCDFVCDPSYDRSDGGTCDCPMGQMSCMDGCHQCCSAGDCAPHVLCNGGSCGGCESGWGDCNNNPADGCETPLNSNNNCGSCGNKCCGSFCGCGVLGFGGKSCKPSGQTYSCQC